MRWVTNDRSQQTVVQKELSQIFFYIQGPWYSVKKNHDALIYIQGRRGRDHIVVGFLIPMQSVPITTNIVSSNPAEAKCTRYNIM